MDETEAWAAHGHLVSATLRAQGLTQDPDREDLEQEGRLALLACIRSFDPARGHKFSSYAIPRIIGAMAQYRRTKATWVKRSGQRAAAAVQAVERELERRGEPVTDDAIRARLERPGDLEKVRRLPTAVRLGPEARQAVEETLPDPQEDVPGAVWERARWLAIVGALEALPWMMREAVRGVDVEGKKASEVARALGIRVTILRRDVLPRGRARLARLLGWEAGVKIWTTHPNSKGERMPSRRYTRTVHYVDTPEGADQTARLAQERGISTGELLRQLARKEAQAAEAQAVKSKKGGK